MKPGEYVPTTQAVLPALNRNAVIFHVALLAAASFLLPAASHLLGLPVRQILPMHWPVLFAGLCYGWRSGAAIGLLAPFTSFLISGMPLPHILPAMTVELAAYGILAGLGREVFRLNWFAATALALVGGRVVFLSFVFAMGSVSQAFGDYVYAAMLPGIPAAIAQLVALSIAAKWWVSRDRKPEQP